MSDNVERNLPKTNERNFTHLAHLGFLVLKC